MAEYISKSALVAEIERRIKEHHSGYLVCLKDILSLLDTLEVKEVDLEKEFDEYTQPITAQDIKYEPFTQLFACAQHFYELGLKAKKGE